MALPVLVATAEEQVSDLVFLSLRHDTWPDQFARWRTSLSDLRLVALGSVTELDDEATLNVYSLKHWEQQELVLANLEGVLDENLLFGANLEFFIILTLADIFELEKFLWPLVTRLIQNVLILMDPLVLLKVDFASVRLTWDLDTPQLLVENVEVHLWIDVWEHLSLGHDVWDDSVVEVLVQQLKLKHLLDSHELCQVLHCKG